MGDIPFFFFDSGSTYPVKETVKKTVSNNTSQPDGIQDFFSVRFASSNAKEMARYFQMVFGMTEIAFLGLENGNRCVSSHVMSKNKVTFEVMGSLETRTDLAYAAGLKQKGIIPNVTLNYKQSFFLADIEKKALQIMGPSAKVQPFFSEGLRYDAVQTYILSADTKNEGKLSALVNEAIMASLISDFAATHGVGVYDIVFKVKGIKRLFSKAVSAGATIIRQPARISDKYGSVWIATIAIPLSDLHHTLVEFIDYAGPYLPNYASIDSKTNKNDKDTFFCEIDHCVQNFFWNQLLPTSRFYMTAFGLHKFWSVDDKDVSTMNSGLRSMVLANRTKSVMMPINEPAESKMRGQIEEFCDYYGGPGVQHVALRTNDIISCVRELKSRGMEFNTMSENYYTDLETRLKFYKIELHEDFQVLKRNNILTDFDPWTRFKQKNGLFHCHYILQIFSKPIHDRPTIFFEIIQRHNHNGFGKGNFKGLFESIEEQQKLRRTLVPTKGLKEGKNLM